MLLRIKAEFLLILRACLLSLGALFSTTVGAVSDATDDSKEISFATEILPQLQQQCGYCHRPYDRHGYLVLDHGSYAAIVNVPSFQLPSMKRVEPGKPDKSYLWRKSIGTHVEAGGIGWEMPVMIGVRGEFKEKLRLWIEQGAKNN